MKKSAFLFPALFACSGFLMAQLPVIKAIGGDGTDIDWPSIKVYEDTASEAVEFFYNDCAQGVYPGKASSTLAPQGEKKYDATNLTDSDPMTAWVEGAAGYGIGEWFEVASPIVNTIYNGYQATPATWKNNSRVKRFKVYLDGAALCYLDLTDEMGEQRFDLGLQWADTLRIYRFEIAEVYKGAKYDDVGISHVDYVACCFAGDSRILTAVELNVAAGSLANGMSVQAYDFNGDSLISDKVTQFCSQQHVTLLHVTAGGKSINITPDHPLNLEGRGFISLAKLDAESPGKNYGELVGNFRVLLWDEVEQKSYYAPIDSIEEIQGDFVTYSVRNLAEGEFYIVNGFISKTY